MVAQERIIKIINAQQQRWLIDSGVANAFYCRWRLFMRRYARRKNESESACERERERERREKKKRDGIPTCVPTHPWAHVFRAPQRRESECNAPMRTACKKVVEGHARSRSLFDSVWDLVHLFERPRPSGLCITLLHIVSILTELKRGPAGKVWLLWIQVRRFRAKCFLLLTSKVDDVSRRNFVASAL